MVEKTRIINSVIDWENKQARREAKMVAIN